MQRFELFPIQFQQSNDIELSTLIKVHLYCVDQLQSIEQSSQSQSQQTEREIKKQTSGEIITTTIQQIEKIYHFQYTQQTKNKLLELTQKQIRHQLLTMFDVVSYVIDNVDYKIVSNKTNALGGGRLLKKMNTRAPQKKDEANEKMKQKKLNDPLYKRYLRYLNELSVIKGMIINEKDWKTLIEESNDVKERSGSDQKKHVVTFCNSPPSSVTLQMGDRECEIQLYDTESLSIVIPDLQQMIKDYHFINDTLKKEDNKEEIMDVYFDSVKNRITSNSTIMKMGITTVTNRKDVEEVVEQMEMIMRQNISFLFERARNEIIRELPKEVENGDENGAITVQDQIKSILNNVLFKRMENIDEIFKWSEKLNHINNATIHIQTNQSTSENTFVYDKINNCLSQSHELFTFITQPQVTVTLRVIPKTSNNYSTFIFYMKKQTRKLDQNKLNPIGKEENDVKKKQHDIIDEMTTSINLMHEQIDNLHFEEQIQSFTTFITTPIRQTTSQKKVVKPTVKQALVSCNMLLTGGTVTIPIQQEQLSLTIKPGMKLTTPIEKKVEGVVYHIYLKMEEDTSEYHFTKNGYNLICQISSSTGHRLITLPNDEKVHVHVSSGQRVIVLRNKGFPIHESTPHKRGLLIVNIIDK